MEDTKAAPISARFFTPGTLVLAGIAVVGGAAALYRIIMGLGLTTNLDNQYPWGIWIALDVATGVALAAGGFTSAALVHIFHRRRYEALVRPALLTAMLGYTFVVMGLCLDLGRYYNIWHPAWPTMWQGNSVLFEVGMCVMVYLNVLYLEFMPLVCERFIGRVALPGLLAKLNGLVDTVLKAVNATLGKVMFLFIIAGVVLSCMHQSSLGALMLIAPYKMNALWYTPILPMLFLMSAIAVGFPMVVFESLWASWSFNRKPEMSLLGPLGKIMVALLGVYAAAKFSDFVIREAYVELFKGGIPAYMWLTEVSIGIILPLFMLSSRRVRRSPRLLFAASAGVILGVVLNRVNVFLVAYTPPYAENPYFPSAWEIVVTIGLVSALVLAYRVLVTLLPVLPDLHTESGTGAASTEKAVHAKTLVKSAPSNKKRKHARVLAGSANLFLLLILGMFCFRYLYAEEGESAGPMDSVSNAPGECADCHSSATPSADDLYHSPCRRSRENWHASEEDSASAPDVVILDQLSDIYVPVVFPHKLHGAMGEMGKGCITCHHHDESGRIQACKNCHNEGNTANLRQPSLKGAYHRQCMNCHREWSHDTDCVVCHAKRDPGKPTKVVVDDPTDIMGRLHPNVEVPVKRVYDTSDLEEGSKVTFHHKEHVELFGNRCVDCHAKENCSNCHDASKPKIERMNEDDPHVLCSKCHNVDDDCTICHMQGEAPGFDHLRRTNFMLKEYHKGLACVECHTESTTYTGLKPECNSCHSDDWMPADFDHSKTGLTFDEAHADNLCQACHIGGLGTPPQCNACHDDNRTPPDKYPGTYVPPSREEVAAENGAPKMSAIAASP